MAKFWCWFWFLQVGVKIGKNLMADERVSEICDAQSIGHGKHVAGGRGAVAWKSVDLQHFFSKGVGKPVEYGGGTSGCQGLEYAEGYFLAGTRKRMWWSGESDERWRTMEKRMWKVKYGAAALLLFCISGLFTACGKEPEEEDWGLNAIPIETDENLTGEGAGDKAEDLSVSEDSVVNDSGETISAQEDIEGGEAEASEAVSQAAGTGRSDYPDSVIPEMDAMQEMFGKDCISEQTFEVQFSEYAQEVYFVPFAPSQENPQFRMQLIRNGQVLTELSAYVPEYLAGSEFTSLDAVSFGDVNFDGNTDILLLETYGDTRFAAVYCGKGEDTREYDYVSFWVEEELSEYLTDQVNPLTFSEISHFLTGGKKNGEFASYQEAYEAVSKVYDLCGEKRAYNLIYFDGDDIPELVAGVDGYFVSLFTYDAGRVYCLMNDWGYGAMGNAGYEYVPGKNSLRNYNADFAGAIMYTTYMTIGEQHSLELVAAIETFHFDDVNGNGIPDEDEKESVGFYGVNYIDGVEVTDEECASYDVGGYEYIIGRLSLEELKDKLGR